MRTPALVWTLGNGTKVSLTLHEMENQDTLIMASITLIE